MYFEILVCAWCRPIGLPWFGNHWLTSRKIVAGQRWLHPDCLSALRTLLCTPHADSIVCKLLQHTRVVHSWDSEFAKCAVCIHYSFLQFFNSWNRFYQWIYFSVLILHNGYLFSSNLHRPTGTCKFSFTSFLPFLVQSVRETFSETIIAPIAHLTAHFAALAVSNPPLSLAVSEWPCKIPKLDPT